MNTDKMFVVILAVFVAWVIIMMTAWGIQEMRIREREIAIKEMEVLDERPNDH